MAALDPYSQPTSATAAANPALIERDRKRKLEDQQLAAGQRAADEAARQQAARNIGTEGSAYAAKHGPIAWNAQPQEDRTRIETENPHIRGEIPGLFNQAVSDATGRVVGPAPGQEGVGKVGTANVQFGQPPATTGTITSKDVADAGIDPNSIPQQDWPAAVAKAKSGREGKMTEMQSNALQYSARMAYNRDVLDKLEAKGFDPASVATGIGNITPNIMRSPEVQTYRAARDNWVSAVLRKESGAAISKSEYENAYRQYFPQMGDAPEIIAQKKNLRKIAEDNMKLVAGGRAAEAETGVQQLAAPPTAPNGQPAPTAAQQQPADKFTVGQQYQDAQGNKATYLGNGKWQ